MKQGLLVLILLASGFLLSQEKIIKGKIYDDFNQPISDVTISVENSNENVKSSIDGSFSIDLEEIENPILIVSSIGFEDKMIAVKPEDFNKEDFIISLQEDNSFSINEVSIITNRDKESIDEIPSTVSVLTAKKIDQLSEFNNSLAGIVANVPGVSLSTNTTTTRGQNIRGRNMLVLIDGIPQSTPLLITNRDLNTIDPGVIDRVEIVKGATSIYGNGAEGGIINYITKKPKGDKKINSTTRVGMSGSLVNTDNTMGNSIFQMFDGKLNDRFSYVISGLYKDTGIMRSAKGEISSPTYGFGETETYNVFTKLGYEINDKHSLEFMYNYFSDNQNSNLIHQDGVLGSKPATGVFGETDSREKDQGTKHNHNVKLSYHINDLFGRTDLDFTGYYQDFLTRYAYRDKFIDLTNGYDGGQNQVNAKKYGARLNLNTPYYLGDIKGNIIYGLDALADETKQQLVDGRGYTPQMEMNNIAPYFQIKANYSDFIFKAGMRYENITVDVDDYTTIYINDGSSESGGVNVVGDKLDYNAVVFNLGLRYNKMQKFKPYLSFSQSFSVGQLGRILRNVKESDAIKNSINAEAVIVDNYELGFVSDITDKIRLQGVGYLSTSDLGVEYVENAETERLEAKRTPEIIYGTEWQLDAKITNKFDAGISFSYIEGEADNNDNGSFSDAEDNHLNSLRISPLVVRGNFDYQINDKWKASLFWTFSGDRDRFDPDENGEYLYGYAPVTSFFVANLFTSYQMSKSTSLVLGVENLFNNDYYTVKSQWAAREDEYSKANGINFNLSLNIKL